MNQLVGLGVIGVLIGAYVVPQATGIILAAIASLYILIGCSDLLTYRYHTRQTMAASESEVRRHIALLLEMEQYELARTLYRAQVANQPVQGRVSLLQKLAGATLIVIGGGLLSNGVTALVGPIQSNVLVALCFVGVCACLLALSHIVYFRVKESRTSDDKLGLLTRNLDTIYEGI